MQQIITTEIAMDQINTVKKSKNKYKIKKYQEKITFKLTCK